MPALPISYSELYGTRPTEDQLVELISSFKTEPTFISLAMWNLMISLFEGHREKYKFLQGFFIQNLIRHDLKSRVEQAAALNSKSPRPVFGRWQLLALMKKVLIESRNDGVRDPRYDDDARRMLGDACLMMSDLLFPQEQEERLNEAAGDRERVSDELMAQMLFQFELYHVPDVYQAVARNNEYFNIFEQRASEFRFSDDQTLGQKFTVLTGLKLPQYLRMYFSIWVLHNSLQNSDPLAINANPSIINFDKERVFGLMDVKPEEREVFFRTVVTTLPSLTEDVNRDNGSTRLWQLDYTTFRNHPLVNNSDSARGFTCIAYPFLTEKLASGVYHTILSSWPEKHPDRARFQGYWGKVFEQFANDRLNDGYPPSPLANRFYATPFFQKKQSGAFIEVSDAVLDYGDALVLIEHKGGYLSLDEKYSGEVTNLLNGVGEKFGKAIKQLSRSIGKLFNEDPLVRDSFGQLDGDGHWNARLSADELQRIRRVYPVLVVQDFSMTIGFMNRRLRLQLGEAIGNMKIDPGVRVCPLTLLTIENLEDVLAHLGDFTLMDVLDEYAKHENMPLSTFNASFRAFLQRNRIEQQRYGWSLRQGEAFVNSIMEHFIKGAEGEPNSLER
jgi:hypothetical protein